MTTVGEVKDKLNELYSIPRHLMTLIDDNDPNEGILVDTDKIYDK